MTARARRPERQFMPRGEVSNQPDDHEQRIRALEVPYPGFAGYRIKVFRDAKIVTAGDGKFIFDIAESEDGLTLVAAEIYVTTVSSSGIVRVQIRNITQASDMLSTRVQVDASEKNSKTAATQAVIDTGNAAVAWADEIAIDVDDAGTGAKGLGVILDFA